MFDWLFEGWPGIYLLLLLPAVILLVLWYRDRRRRWLFALAGVLLVIGLYYLLDHLVQTRFENVRGKLLAMKDGVHKGDSEAIFKHISPQFRYGYLDRQAFRKGVDALLTRKEVTELVIYDVKMGDRLDNENSATGGKQSAQKKSDRPTVKVTFRAKPKGPVIGKDVYFLVRSEFVQDSDGEWRLLGFEVFNPYSDSRSPLDASPHLPGR